MAHNNGTLHCIGHGATPRKFPLTFPSASNSNGTTSTAPSNGTLVPCPMRQSVCRPPPLLYSQLKIFYFVKAKNDLIYLLSKNFWKELVLVASFFRFGKYIFFDLLNIIKLTNWYIHETIDLIQWHLALRLNDLFFEIYWWEQKFSKESDLHTLTYQNHCRYCSLHFLTVFKKLNAALAARKRSWQWFSSMEKVSAVVAKKLVCRGDWCST